MTVGDQRPFAEELRLDVGCAEDDGHDQDEEDELSEEPRKVSAEGQSEPTNDKGDARDRKGDGTGHGILTEAMIRKADRRLSLRKPERQGRK